MYKIIVDSSCDLSKDEIKQLNICYVPFRITIDGNEYVDDDNLDIKNYLEEMRNTPNPIKTACPSPYEFLQIIEDNLEDDIYIITISSKLSGSYNSAAIAVKEAKEKYNKDNICLIDSLSASAGQTRLALNLLEFLKENDDFSVVSQKIQDEVKNMFTFFVLDNMQNLIKNGRIKKTTGLIANMLNIRPIMKGKDGEIELFEINRGMKKSLDKLATAMGSLTDDIDQRIVTISHVDDYKRAEFLADKIKNLYNPKEIVIRQANGLSSGYADIGGIVLAF